MCWSFSKTSPNYSGGSDSRGGERKFSLLKFVRYSSHNKTILLCTVVDLRTLPDSIRSFHGKVDLF